MKQAIDAGCLWLLALALILEGSSHLAQGSSGQGLKEGQAPTDSEDTHECPCKQAPSRRSVDDGKVSGRARRYTTSTVNADYQPSGFASTNSDYTLECNAYAGRSICYRFYRTGISAPPSDFTCWNVPGGGRNCTETENLRFIESNDARMYDSSSPTSNNQQGYYPQRSNGYDRPQAQQYNNNQPMDQPRYNPNRQQQVPVPRDSDFGVPAPKDSEFGAVNNGGYQRSSQPQSNVKVSHQDPYSSP